MSEHPGVVLRQPAPRGCLNLRADPRSIETVPGILPPVAPCTWRRAGDTAVYWLGPDEWLLLVPAGTEGAAERRLRDALEGSFSVVDTTGAHCMVNLSGPSLGQVMQKSSPYDFHPRNFPAGRCVQTTFAKASALVAANPDGSFDLVFRRSYANYVQRWIADAAAEYGFRQPAASPDSSRRSGRTPA